MLIRRPANKTPWWCCRRLSRAELSWASTYGRFCFRLPSLPIGGIGGWHPASPCRPILCVGPSRSATWFPARFSRCRVVNDPGSCEGFSRVLRWSDRDMAPASCVLPGKLKPTRPRTHSHSYISWLLSLGYRAPDHNHQVRRAQGSRPLTLCGAVER